ncbi:MAG: hypothetical protein ACXVCX_08545 [Ktedonobacterales bacterium]
MADTKTKAQTMSEPQAENEKAENEMVQAAREWTETLREAGKAVADTAIAIQDRNVHFTQYVVDQGLKQIEDQTASLRTLYGTLSSTSDARRAAFRHLGREAAQAYIGFLATPVKLAQQAAETVREAAKPDAGKED